MEKLNEQAHKKIRMMLKEYITENFLPSSGLKGFADSDSFLERGIIDSTGVLELLEFIEDKFNIRVEDFEIVPDNLDSLDKLTFFIARKLSAC